MTLSRSKGRDKCFLNSVHYVWKTFSFSILKSTDTSTQDILGFESPGRVCMMSPFLWSCLWGPQLSPTVQRHEFEFGDLRKKEQGRNCMNGSYMCSILADCDKLMTVVLVFVYFFGEVYTTQERALGQNLGGHYKTKLMSLMPVYF